MNIQEIHRKGCFRVFLSHVDVYGKGRAYLAGDSAHSHSPVGGRGMNLGISDAADLATRIAGEKTLDTYSYDRLKEAERVIR